MKKTFLSFLEKYKDKKLVISTHRHPDSDGIASMYAIGSFLKNPTYALQDHPAEDTQSLIEKLGMKCSFLKDLNKEDYAGLIVLDCHSYVLLRDSKDWPLILIIDHHEDESKNMHAEFEIIKSDAHSNVEIIYDLIPDINKDIAFALAVGIISDTARFKSADSSTFKKLSDLMEISGSNYKELFNYAYPQEPISKRNAVLMAFQRAESIEYKGYLIVTSHVGTNESTAATLLSDVADFVFIASEKHHETRISGRAGAHTSIPINEIMFKSGKRLNGAGGGHAKAAGAMAKVDYKEALRTCVNILKEFIDKEK